MARRDFCINSKGFILVFVNPFWHYQCQRELFVEIGTNKKNMIMLLLEEVHSICVNIKVVMFTLVTCRSEIPKDTYASFCEAHVIPQLLTMVRANIFRCLALDERLFLNKEIHKVLMTDALAMKLNREIVLTGKRHNLAFFKHNFQCVLIHIFVQERPQAFVNLLTTPINIVAPLFEFLAQRRIFIYQPFYSVIFHSCTSFTAVSADIVSVCMDCPKPGPWLYGSAVVWINKNRNPPLEEYGGVALVPAFRFCLIRASS